MMLKQMLERVSDSYSDFVHGVMLIAKRENIEQELIEFISQNPTADSSEISEYMFDNLIKSKPTYDFEE